MRSTRKKTNKRNRERIMLKREDRYFCEVREFQEKIAYLK